MKIINKSNLPEYLVKLISQDDYDRHEGVWSASDLKKPSRMFALEQLYPDECKIDVVDLIPAWYGTAIHNMFEKADIKGFEQEKRLYAEVQDQKISGKFDLLMKLSDGFRLKDIKSTSTYKYTNKDFDDYIIQLSIYRWLLSKNGYENVDIKADIIFLFTDWMRSKTVSDGYPSSRLLEQEIQLWSLDKTEKYIKERIFSHRVAIETISIEKESEVIVRCTKEELWQDDDKYAVMKTGGSRALKLCSTGTEAKEIIDNHKDKDKLFIQKRVPEPRRCSYCSCQSFCRQYLQMQDRA